MSKTCVILADESSMDTKHNLYCSEQSASLDLPYSAATCNGLSVVSSRYSPSSSRGTGKNALTAKKKKKKKKKIVTFIDGN